MTRLFQIAFWLALVAAFVMATLPNPPDLPVEASDKLQHMTAFATLALLAALAYRRLPLLVLAAGLAGFGALIEAVQMIPSLHRDAELLDFMADSAAIFIVLLLVAAARGIFALQRRG